MLYFSPLIGEIDVTYFSKNLFLLGLILGLAGCGWALYKDAQVGKLDGSVFLLWVGETDKPLGDGKFIYVPVPDDELTFQFQSTRAKYTIVPDPIYTDGGSIPKPAQIFKGFSPWDYAPAYILHDWIFVANRCLGGEYETENMKRVQGMTFIESAELVGAALRTLADDQTVFENSFAKATITGAVSLGFSETLWVRKEGCAKDQLSPQHRKKVAEFRSQYLAARRQGAEKRFAARAAPVSGIKIMGQFSY